MRVKFMFNPTPVPDNTFFALSIFNWYQTILSILHKIQHCTIINTIKTILSKTHGL